MERKPRQLKRMDGPVRGTSRPKAAGPKKKQPQVAAAAMAPAPKAAVAKSAPQAVPAKVSVDDLQDFNHIDLGEVTPEGYVLEENNAPNRWWQRLTRKQWGIATVALMLTVVGFVGVKAVLASQKVVTENSGDGAPSLKGEIDPTKLKGEGDGRINVLLLGVGGSGHNGGQLSDTIMVASIDPINKTMAMLSIPRDLYVKIPGYSYSKINAANSYGGPELAKQVVGGILDLPIHYYAQVDFAGFKQAVDAVGGVDIKNETKLYDSSFPCDNNRGYCPFSLPAGQYHMDGKTALKYARCRHGSCGNDFGRAERQQQVLVALRQEALDASTLTNPMKIAGLLDSIGDHVRTDMQLNESQKLAKIIKDIDISKATTKVLDDSPEGLLMFGGSQFPGAGSVLIPKAGAFEYSDIQELAHSIFIDAYLAQEKAAVSIQNGTARTGLGAAVGKQLKAYNYNVVGISSADRSTYTQSVIIDYSGGKKPYTVKYLESRFKATVQKATRPAAPATASTTGTVVATPDPDIVIIVGNNYKPATR